jgi:hypothetical protein
MAKLGINTGTTPNDGTGDTLLSAALKINQNFNEIYNSIGNGTTLTGQISYASTSGISYYSTYSLVSGVSTYSGTSGISSTSQGLTGSPNINVGIITANSGSVVIGGGTTSIITNGDVNIIGNAAVGLNTSNGLILTSQNGTKYRVYVNNDGSLSTVVI